MKRAKPKTYYVIVSTVERGFWSNDAGWGFDIGTAERYTAKEIKAQMSDTGHVYMCGHAAAVLAVTGDEITFLLDELGID